MLDGFSLETAVKWLRGTFDSFDGSSRCEISLETDKNEGLYFSSAHRLGYVTELLESKGSTVSKPLLVVAVEMRKSLTERTSRLVQFNFAKKQLKAAVVHGATGVKGIPSQGIFFFYDSEGTFRISLVTGSIEGRSFKFSSAKRQSFYAETGRPNNILRRRLNRSLATFASLKDAFSVDQLTKEFYGELFAWYEWAMDPKVGVTFPNDTETEAGDRKQIPEALIRLITRLMFTWFIKQKGLVPKELFDKDAVAQILKSFNPGHMKDDNYYRCILQNLFFATFNCPAKNAQGNRNRKFVKVFQGKSNEHGVKTCYRYSDEFVSPDSFVESMMRIPFLNCALFDCLDRVKRPEEGKGEMLIDGFSQKSRDRMAHVPNGLFFDEERGLVKLFNQYEFTVNENDADDSDVALDPELLGKVFENLLGAFNEETKETARKATGSFYTPREIVDYMVEESLKNYIKSKVATADDNRLADLFDRSKAATREKTLFSKDERDGILDAIYDCKVLDPACGSGAFPMGVLHCMMRLLTRLDPDCLRQRAMLLRRYQSDVRNIDPALSPGEREERRQELEALFKEENDNPDYARKLYLIENCIYGVDIQPIATQISKLRFFISLICDQFRSTYDLDADNSGLLSLPNLEAKFVCANTLISLPKLESGELALSTGNVQSLRDDLQANRHQIFKARTAATKQKYRNRDLEIRKAIESAVHTSLGTPDAQKIALWEKEIATAREKRLAVVEPKLQKRMRTVQKDLFSGVETISETIDLNKAERDRLDDIIASCTREIAREQAKAKQSSSSALDTYARLVAGWDPYDQNACSSFFDPKWMFNIEKGFDIVIGNPPYVQLQADGGRYAKLYADCGYRTFCRTGDLYCLFTERGYDLLASDGVESYIMPNKWMLVEYGRSLRGFLREGRMLRLLNFGDVQFFDNATNYVVVFFEQKGTPVETVEALSLNQKNYSGSFLEAISQLETFPASIFGEEGWMIQPRRHYDILEKMKARGKALKDFLVEINYGIKTGYNEAFYIDAETRARLIAEDPKSEVLVKPLLRGRDVEAFLTPPTGIWLINTHNGVKEKCIKPVFVSEFPAVKRYLDRYLSKLSARGDKGDTSYNLRNCAYLDAFASPKIVYPNMTSRFPFSYDEDGYFINDKGFILNTTKDKDFLKYLVGIFNSKLAKLWIWYNTPELVGGAREIRKVYFEHIPIPDVGEKEQWPIIGLVDRILGVKKVDPDSDTSALEAEIDLLVYKLYDLTPEEIAIVEGNGKQEKGESKVAPKKVRKTAAKSKPTPKPVADDEWME